MPGAIQSVFDSQSKASKRWKMIAYSMAGDIAAGASVIDQARRCRQWVQAGVDVLEIGVPFSDPMADGPSIQRAHHRSLQRGTRLTDVFDLISAIRSDGCRAPVVVMSYLNPLLQYGLKNTVAALKDGAVDGLLLVDCPAPEHPELYEHLLEEGIDPITLVAPNTPEGRLRKLLKYARGFIYALSLKGVTGSQLNNYSALARQIETIRTQTALPIAVGFGIRHPEQLSSLPEAADAVVVGSALVELTECAASVECPEAIKLIEEFCQYSP